MVIDIPVMLLLLMTSSGPVHHLLPYLQNDLWWYKPISRTPLKHEHSSQCFFSWSQLCLSLGTQMDETRVIISMFHYLFILRSRLFPFFHSSPPLTTAFRHFPPLKTNLPNTRRLVLVKDHWWLFKVLPPCFLAKKKIKSSCVSMRIMPPRTASRCVVGQHLWWSDGGRM